MSGQRKWRCAPNDLDVYDQSGDLVCAVSMPNSYPESEANAALICAAPDLLAALRGLLDCVYVSRLENNLGSALAASVEQARLAIEKAGGA